MKRFMIRTAIAATLMASSIGIAAADGHLLSESVPSGHYQMDTQHGYVTFTYSHFGLSNPQISFKTVDAGITLDAENPAASAVNVTITANSIDSDIGVFNDHLNSENWFDTAQFPEITFVSTSLTQDAENYDKGTLTGDLTIKGITKPITLDVDLLGSMGEHPINKAPTIGVNATGSVLRSDFGLGAYAPAVSDKITITVSGEFNRVEEPKGS
ncbi:MAG: YceI family protein [Hyphomonadaceae bacterium]